MGALHAYEAAQIENEDTGLLLHLTSNHYPSIGFMLDTAKAALAAIREDDESKEIALPDGVANRKTGGHTMKAWRVIESLHLEAWL